MKKLSCLAVERLSGILFLALISTSQLLNVSTASAHSHRRLVN